MPRHVPPMTPERWQRVKELCDLALARDPRERNAFVAELCREDAELRHDVETMLAQANGGEGVLDAPTCETAGTHGDPDQSRRRAVGALAAGGCRQLSRARAWSARAAWASSTGRAGHPRRTVALKVIRPGLTTPGPAAPLRAARPRSSAACTIPASPRSTRPARRIRGRPQPFFAMEFVRGEPLRDYAERAPASTTRAAARAAGADLRRRAARPPARPDPPRPQAGQHPGGRGRPAQGARLRRGAADRRRRARPRCKRTSGSWSARWPT